MTKVTVPIPWWLTNQPPELFSLKSKVPFLTLHFKAIHVVAFEGSEEGDCQSVSSPKIWVQT